MCQSRSSELDGNGVCTYHTRTRKSLKLIQSIAEARRICGAPNGGVFEFAEDRVEDDAVGVYSFEVALDDQLARYDESVNTFVVLVGFQNASAVVANVVT